MHNFCGCAQLLGAVLDTESEISLRNSHRTQNCFLSTAARRSEKNRSLSLHTPAARRQPVRVQYGTGAWFHEDRENASPDQDSIAGSCVLFPVDCIFHTGRTAPSPGAAVGRDARC